MNTPFSRRQFLRTGVGTASLTSSALAGYGFLSGLPRVSAAEAEMDPGTVRFRPEIEPLVRLLEDTPRERLLEKVAERIQRGTTYREVLTALQLAGVRNIQPRPVGFKFHAVLVVNSAHLASQNSPDEDRWLPIFWALDQFKSSQARDVQEGNWTLAAVDEKAVPSAGKARAAFMEAMDSWDEARTDVAVAGLARSSGAQELFDLLCRYGARDFRDIGHKIIYVANSWRTLQNIGWQHAEPVLRSLAYALLEHDGNNPANLDEIADRPGRRNLERVNEIQSGWQVGKPKSSASAAASLLGVLRQADWDQAATTVVEMLNRGTGAQAIWDAYFQHAAEMLMRRPGIVSLHACTTANALHYAWLHTFNDETRRFLMLQAASFLTLFRNLAGAGTGDISIDTFEPGSRGKQPSLDDIFAEVGSNSIEAARQALAWLQPEGEAGGQGSEAHARSFIDAAQRYIYLKGTNSHDYKFSSAVLEDYHHVSPGVRDRFLAGSVFWLKGAGEPDSPLVSRTRAAFG